MAPAIIFILIMAIFIVLYSYKLSIRAIELITKNSHKGYIKAIAVIISLFIGIKAVNVFGISAIIIMHFLAFCLLCDGIYLLLSKIPSLSQLKENKLLKYIRGFCIIPLIATITVLSYGYINFNNVQETHYTVYTDKNIRPEGYRIALIADVHYGVSLDKEEIREICEEISQKDIDIVALCGDITDDNTTKQEFGEIFEVLGDIESEFGTYYVYGNHDLQSYSKNPAYNRKYAEDMITKSGITILCDQVTEISSDFVIAGRNDASHSMPGHNNTKKRMDISKLIKDVNKELFILTLDHQPKDYIRNAQSGADLILSGHTHGGQIWPVNIIDKIVKFNEASYGQIHIDNDTDAIVTSGFAGWNYPIKTSAPAEYVIIDIKKKDI